MPSLCPWWTDRALTLCVNVLEFEAFKRVLLARRQQMGKVAPLYLIKCAD